LTGAEHVAERPSLFIRPFAVYLAIIVYLAINVYLERETLMRLVSLIRVGIVALGLGMTGGALAADDEGKFTFKYLNDDANVEAGAALWKQQCRHCHGASAYPGKAPKLKPYKYTPEFVYDRVTNGFRKMPPWKAVYSQEQRMALTAFIKSRSFSP
jgi:mono/diheme cytochrome c family protein